MPHDWTKTEKSPETPSHGKRPANHPTRSPPTGDFVLEHSAPHNRLSSCTTPSSVIVASVVTGRAEVKVREHLSSTYSRRTRFGRWRLFDGRCDFGG